jgi:hypothetical protein
MGTKLKPMRMKHTVADRVSLNYDDFEKKMAAVGRDKPKSFKAPLAGVYSIRT